MYEIRKETKEKGFYFLGVVNLGNVATDMCARFRPDISGLRRRHLGFVCLLSKYPKSAGGIFILFLHLQILYYNCAEHVLEEKSRVLPTLNKHSFFCTKRVLAQKIICQKKNSREVGRDTTALPSK